MKCNKAHGFVIFLSLFRYQSYSCYKYHLLTVPNSVAVPSFVSETDSLQGEGRPFPIMNSEEIWRDIPGWEGYYQVSNLGNVKSLDRYILDKRHGRRFYKGAMLAQPMMEQYKCVRLSAIGKRKTPLVHSLVALAFIDANYKAKKLTVNHKDCNKLNNRADNLEVITLRENYIHAQCMGMMRKGEAHSRSRFTNEDVLNIKDLIASGETNKAISELYACSESAIQSIRLRKTWKHITYNLKHPDMKSIVKFTHYWVAGFGWENTAFKMDDFDTVTEFSRNDTDGVVFIAENASKGKHILKGYYYQPKTD